MRIGRRTKAEKTQNIFHFVSRPAQPMNRFDRNEKPDQIVDRLGEHIVKGLQATFSLDLWELRRGFESRRLAIEIS
jgi:hypothetical protein